MRTRIGMLLAALLIVACQARTTQPEPAPSPPTTTSTSTSASTPPATATPSTASPSTTTASTPPPPTTTSLALPEGVTDPPGWLGERPLPVDEEGEAVPQPTPPELVDRRFTTTDLLPPPPDDSFHSSIGSVPPEVAERSTWSEECPVDLEDLAYVTITFLGFDQEPHTGELMVAEAVAEDVVSVFRRLYEAEFPIEQMRITSPRDLEADPTGDGNVTAAFVCRPVTGGSGWSQHAYGLAIDINPFHNPYVRGDIVLPELAGAYADRDRDLPGMIHEGDPVTRAFDDIGWGWGGRWTSLDDPQHFSRNGR
ncbi:MAG: M15 family metallopeptidase [Actinomycetota bacterium]